ncbi:MAG TPA: pilus assembly protein [Candidatus Stackebrandtia faecavium]|nr:pilus assembly protein [Candidatus Stackebrandtia faecavium]
MNAAGRRTGPHGESGYATVELALSLPVIVMLLLAGMFGISAAQAQIRCADAARDAALALARGHDDADAALEYAPPDAQMSVSHGADDNVHVEVSAQVSPAGAWLPSVIVTGSASAAMEPEGP